MDTKSKNPIHTQTAIQNPDTDNFTQFGQVLAISEDESSLAIQAQNGDGSLAVVFIYQRGSQQSWQLAFRLEPKRVAAPEKGNWKTICQADQTVKAWDGQGFGSALALSADGQSIAVGAPWAAQQEDDEDTVGAVYFFRRQASGGGWKMSVLNNDDSQANEEFGASVGLGDGILAIGAPGQSAGSIYVLETGLGYDDALEVNWSGNNRNMTSIPCPDAAQSRFGAAIALDGKTIAVGAPGSSKQAGGRVYVFQQAGPKNWSAQAPVSLTAAGVAQFGRVLALSGKALLAGGADNAGALMFEAPGGNWAKATQKTLGLAQDPIPSLGHSIAASNHKLVLGSDNKGVFAAQRGAAPGSRWGPLARQMDNGGQAVCAGPGFVVAGGGGQVQAAFLPVKPHRGTFTDPRPQANGKVYQTQDFEIDGIRRSWMVENLAYYDENDPKLKNGSWIYNDGKNKQGQGDPSILKTYGRLYTWEAALAACPPGWRLPADADWEGLAKIYGSVSYSPEGIAANAALIKGGESGFGALFGGCKEPEPGHFGGLDSSGYYWSATEDEANPDTAYFYSFYSKGNMGNDNEYKEQGYSCRYISRSGVFTDPRDGKTYTTLDLEHKGKSLTMMTENLCFEVKDGGSWFYDDNPANGALHGRLYTLEAAQKACPPGWRLPDLNERGLVLHLTASAGGGGYRDLQGKFHGNGRVGGWWWSTAKAGEPWFFLYTANVDVPGSVNEQLGISVFCLKERS